MFILEDKILPIGDKVKEIRKYLGLKQKDLTDDKISRNLISYIENGKTKLTEENAKIISNIFERTIEEKDMNYEVSSKYLLLDKKEQGRFLVSKYINKAKNITSTDEQVFLRYINKGKEIIKECNLPKESSLIYEMLGDYYFGKHDTTNAYINYLKSLKANNELEDNTYKSAQLVYKMAECAINEKKYLSAIEIYDYSIFLIDYTNLKDTIYFNCLLNIAISYKKLGKYDEAIKYITEIENEFLELPYKNMIELKEFEALVYMDKREYNKSEDILNSIIKTANENDDIVVSLEAKCNLVVLYKRKEDYKKAINYGKDIVKSYADIDSKKLITILNNIGYCYKRLEKYDLSEKYLLRGIDEANRKDIWGLKAELYYQLIEIYIITREIYIVNRLAEDIKISYPKVKSKDNIDHMDRLVIKLSKIMIDIDKDISKDLLNMILEGEEYA